MNTANLMISICNLVGNMLRDFASARNNYRKLSPYSKAVNVIFLTMLLLAVGCGPSKEEREAAEAERAAKQAALKAQQEAHEEELQRFSEESMLQMVPEDLELLIVEGLRKRTSWGGPSPHRDRALAGISLLPPENRSSVWEQCPEEIQAALVSEQKHRLLFLEDDELEANHFEFLLRHVSDSSSGEEIERCVRVLATAKRCDEAVPVFVGVLQSNPTKAIATTAVDYLRELDSETAHAALRRLVDESPNLRRPLAVFLPVTADLQGDAVVAEKIRGLVAPDHDMLAAISYLKAVQQQVERIENSTSRIEKDNEIASLKSDAIDTLTAVYPRQLIMLKLLPPGTFRMPTIVTLSKNQLNDLDEYANVQQFDQIMSPVHERSTGPFSFGGAANGTPGASNRDASAPQKLGIEYWEESSSKQLIELFDALPEEHSEYIIETLINGLNVPHGAVSLSATKKLKNILSPEEFPKKFFAYLATRDEYSMSEVDTYIAFLVGHCGDRPDAIGMALQDEIDAVEGDVGRVSWIKKIIGLRSLQTVGTTPELNVVEAFQLDDGEFREVSERNIEGLVLTDEEKSTKFAEIATQAANAIKARGNK